MTAWTRTAGVFLSIVMLAGCAAGGRELPYPPAAPASPGSPPPVPENIPMREYVPDASRSRNGSGWGYTAPTKPRSAAGNNKPVEHHRPAGTGHPRGSGTAPDLLAPTTTAPKIAPPPAAADTRSATDRFKRDLLQPEVDRLRQQDALGRLDPIQQRDLMQREQELRQYQPGR